MGQIQSIDSRHVGIYKKMLAIQNPATRLQMIDTLLGDASIVHSAKQSGIYAQLLQVAAAIRHGHQPPLLPGESISIPQSQPQPQQRVNQTVQANTNTQIHRTGPDLSTQNHYTQVNKPKRSEKALNFFSACLRILNIHEEVALTEEMLKTAYKKSAIRAHPDKQGGSKEAFDAVTRAYAYLIDILKLVKGSQTQNVQNQEELENLDQIQEKRHSASKGWELPADPVKLNPKNLNITVFNKLFEETRMPDPDEDGYGDWLKDEDERNGSGSSLKQKRKGSKKFSEDFNREIFNRMFEEDQEEETNTSIMQFQYPQELIMAPSAGVELGRDRPTDYTAAPNANLQFTDLRAAYTKENTVSNQIKGIHIENRDFHNYKAQRERAPDVYNQNELEMMSVYEAKQKAKEDARRIRAAQEQHGANDYFERMKQYVITEK
jgi:curved DNA-binding protein CbpA